MPKVSYIHLTDGELERKRKAALREIAVAHARCHARRALRLIACLSQLLNGPQTLNIDNHATLRISPNLEINMPHRSCAAEHRSYLDR